MSNISMQSQSQSSSNETFIKLLKEIRDRDTLIKDIKQKIEEKDILIEQLTQLAKKNTNTVNTSIPLTSSIISPSNNNIMYNNLTNQITSFYVTLNTPIPKEPSHPVFQTQQQHYTEYNVVFEGELFIPAKNDLYAELEKSTKLNEILNQEKQNLCSKLNSNKTKVKQIFKIVNDKLNLCNKKNILLSESIMKITNNVTKAEKEKYDLEEIIFQQEDKINMLNKQIAKLLEVNEQKNEVIHKNKLVIKELNDKMEETLQKNLMLKRKNRNYNNSSMLKLPSISKTNSKHKGNTLFSSLQLSSSMKNILNNNNNLNIRINYNNNIM